MHPPKNTRRLAIAEHPVDATLEHHHLEPVTLAPLGELGVVAVPLFPNVLAA